MITKQDLLDLGFTENFVPAEESGDNDYYYYTLDFGDDCILISDASDEALDGFRVELFNHPNLGCLQDKNKINELIKILKSFIV